MKQRKEVVILGSGRSAYSLISYLSEQSDELNIGVTAIDKSAKKTMAKLNNYTGKAIDGDLTDPDFRRACIKKADLVISMLPVKFHVLIAEDCIQFRKHMITASYVTPEMEALDAEAKKAGVLLLNEVGLDPGIDHMSAMKVMDEIKERGGTITEFESFTGGLLAPECEDANPWRYKFTWNPRNVVLAGSGGAVKFIDHGIYKYIPYHRIFRRTEIVDLGKYGKFEGYANRDSLKYRKLYGLDGVQTMYRGTLRRPGFCKAWDLFVQLGLTDDSYEMEGVENMTFRTFINSFLKYHPTDSVELKLMQYLKLAQDDVEIMEKLESLDLFRDERIPFATATPAQVLQYILERKWTLEEGDKDMIVMWHKFIYEKNGQEHEKHAYMVVKGEDLLHTAMSKTVGFPLVICAEEVLKGNIDSKGVTLPLDPSLYNPVLRKLRSMGIEFEERMIR